MTQAQHFRRTAAVAICLSHGITDHLNLERRDSIL